MPWPIYLFISCFIDIYRVKDRGIKRKESSSNVVVGSETAPVSPVDQRRFILQVTFEKLRRLEDPEACLRRTVLINNTLKMLHKQIYQEENPFVCGGLATLQPSECTAREEASPSNPKVIRLSFDNNVTEEARTKRVDNSTALTPGENLCSGCTLSDVYTEEVEDDVFEPAEEISSDRESIFGELDNVFHSYICALETWVLNLYMPFWKWLMFVLYICVSPRSLFKFIPPEVVIT